MPASELARAYKPQAENLQLEVVNLKLKPVCELRLYGENERTDIVIIDEASSSSRACVLDTLTNPQLLA